MSHLSNPRRRARPLLWGAGLSLLAALLAAAPACGQTPPPPDPELEHLQVVAPYIELHTGPGRGYPIFLVVERSDWVEVRLRHTDWFKVRTVKGVEGWVDRAQLENTLTASGDKKSFRDVLLDDYLKRHVEVGAGWGHFSTNPMLKLWASYNLVPTLAIEASAGQVQGYYSNTNYWQIDLMAQPWSDQRLEPFFAVGLGRINNIPSTTLVSAISSNANMGNAMIGVRYHVTDRLVARLDWSAYSALISGSRTEQYRAITAGVSFFF